MKAIIINDDIKIYQELPKSWGNVIGGFNLLSDEQLQSYGFYDVVKPDHDSKVEILSNLHFDADNNIFTYDVNDKNWSETLSELKDSRITQLNEKANQLLSKTDWEIIRQADTGQEVNEETQTERNEIRENVESIEAEINAKTTKKSVMSYIIEL